MRLTLYTLIILPTCLGLLQAQTRSDRQVERLYYLGNYQALARDAITPAELRPQTLLYYASAYYALGANETAYTLYQIAFSKLSPTEAEPTFLAEYGRLCLLYDDPAKASGLFNEALSRVSLPDSQALLSLYIAYANQLKGAREEAPPGYRWVVYNLRRWNTSESEYALFFHKGEAYFISRRDPDRKLDPDDQIPHEGLYVASLTDSSVKPVGFFAKGHEGIAGFIGDTMIVYRSLRRRGDFYIAEPAPNSWYAPKKWKAFPNSRKGSETSICEDPKAGVIIFSSDRKGTKGGLDLWITRRLPNGKYSEPENLSALNTPYNEDAPYVVGDTLFFSHDGPTSMGGYDIFYSVRQPGGGWGKPERLPRPFNSPGQDSYFWFARPDTFYLSSNRPGGLGKMDLYMILKEPLPPPPVEEPVVAPRVYVFQGRVYDVRTQQPVAAQIVLKPVGSGASFSVESPAGQFSQPKPLAGTYLLYAYAPGYAQYVEMLTVPDTGDVSREIAMLPEEVLKRLRLPRLHFNFDKYNLRAETPPALDTVIKILEQYPTLRIEIAGHTDSIGTREYNQGLSERRANTVYQYLIQRGIPAHRLSPRGYSEDRPLVPNSTPYNRFLNRRVEFTPLTGRPAELD